ncbi:MAG TPA: RidA family protein [Salinisphaeraceae bacterium]|nr:RidA family protein [Salinisphaeraceae bacterium]
MTGKFLKPAVAGLLFAAAGVFSTTQVLAADNVVRHDIPDSDFPVAEGVEVGPDATVLYLSGNVPPVVDESADDQTTAAYGNTETQTRNVLKAIAGKLDALGYGMGDVVKMNAYVATEPDANGVDFDGFMAAYTEFFGTDEQPNLPARTTLAVPQMVNPGWLVEIDVIAAQ